MNHTVKGLCILCFFLLNSLLSAQQQSADAYYLIPTIDTALYDKWYNTLSESPPVITSVQQVVTGEQFNLVLFLMKYAKDQDNLPHMTYDITIYTPSGSAYFHQDNIPALTKPIIGDNLLLSETNIRMNFEPEDSYGTYAIVAVIKDLVAHTESTINTSIALVKKKKIKKINSSKSLYNWMMNNFQSPEPERLVNGLIYYITSPLSKKDNSYPPVLGFTVTVLKEHPYLFDELFEQYNEAELRTKFFILNILQYFEDNEKVITFINRLPQKEQFLYSQTRDPDRLLTTENIHDAAQLDALWGAFYGSGKYEFILALVKTLELQTERPIIYVAAAWSLGSNCKQNYLVREYCRYIYQNESVSDEVREELGKILSQQ